MTGWRWAGVLLVAAVLRLPSLELRPMHGDEAVMAVKAGKLAWGGEGSAYDPTGYHGTLLAWMSRPVLWVTGAKSLADTDERHFRIVTAVCGVLLCLTPWLLADGLGKAGAQIAGLLLAVSPAFVYWSRFYIQEVPLVLATALGLGCGWRFARSKRNAWLWGAAVSAGLMFSLKETAWLSLAAGVLALVAVKPARAWLGRNWIRLGWPALAAIAIPAAILGPAALLAPIHYWRLGISGGDHAHPWHWYFSSILLSSGRSLDGAIVGLTLLVAARSMWSRRPWTGIDRNLAMVVSAWTILLALGYSALPYKTPWCLLNFLLGACLLTGSWFSRIPEAGREWRRTHRQPPDPRWVVPVVGIAALAGAIVMATAFTFHDEADRRNPYVYAQPVEDVRRLGKLVRSIAGVHPDGREMIIAVSAENPWPLPWELRGFSRVGYWKPGDPEAGPVFRMAAVRISPATPDSQGMMFGVRPGEILSVETDRRLLDGALRRY